jgi:hypothetical protein
MFKAFLAGLFQINRAAHGFRCRGAEACFDNRAGRPTVPDGPSDAVGEPVQGSASVKRRGLDGQLNATPNINAATVDVLCVSEKAVSKSGTI